MDQSQVRAVFPAHPLYRGPALLALAAAFLLLWELRRGWAWSHGLAGGLALAMALYYARLALSRVELSATHVRWVAPPYLKGFRSWARREPPGRGVELRQIAEVHSEGRLIPALLVLYHPRRDDGLFDHEQLRSLALPAVERQDALLAALGGAAKEQAPP